MRVSVLVLMALWAGSGAAGGQTAVPVMIETPVLAERVASGALPPVGERIPLRPRITDPAAMGREVGKPGGMLRLLVGDQKDLKVVTQYGYTRLLTYGEGMQLQPDILDSYEVTEDRIFTLHLRPGHKWSSGQPFTTEDFRYYWEDVLGSKKLYPDGLPQQLLVDGKGPKFQVIDPVTVRYAWEKPNPGFLPAMANAQPFLLFMPSAYLKQFHERYADKAKLAEVVKAVKVKDWGALHERKSRSYRQENPELPTLDGWWNRTNPPSEFFVFERNPYYHRIDAQGHQLPYIDKIRLQTATSNLIAAKAGSGESDLQAQYVRFEDYTFLKEAEKRNGFEVRLWNRGEGAYAALQPNLNTKDAVWRGLLSDVRFRRALSIGIDRHDINRVIFFGLAKESANTVIPLSPLFRPELENAWAKYDPDKANALLDELGLTAHDIEGYRKLPDGRRAEFTVETAGESTDETDVLELVAEDYRKLGLRIIAHSAHRDVFRRRAMSGESVMSIWPGMDNAVQTADMEPASLAPSDGSQLNWPRWGLHIESGGKQGDPITVPAAQKLADLLQQWRGSSSSAQRQAIWTEMLDINADQVFTIGIVNRIPQPILVSNLLKNVPKTGTYSFEPGAFFGMYRTDLFYFSNVAVAGVK